MRCQVCHSEMERYALFGKELNNVRHYGYRCKVGHFKIEVHDILTSSNLFGQWMDSSAGGDLLDVLIYRFVLFLARTLWFVQCGFSHEKERIEHADDSNRPE